MQGQHSAQGMGLSSRYAAPSMAYRSPMGLGPSYGYGKSARYILCIKADKIGYSPMGMGYGGYGGYGYGRRGMGMGGMGMPLGMGMMGGLGTGMLLGKSALADGQTSADGQVVVSVGSVVDMVVDLEEEIVVEEVTEVAALAKAEKEKQKANDLKSCIILFDRFAQHERS